MALGVRNDHSSTVKKPGFPSKAPLGKTGSQLKRPPCSSSGLQPPSKVNVLSACQGVSVRFRVIVCLGSGWLGICLSVLSVSVSMSSSVWVAGALEYV